MAKERKNRLKVRRGHVGEQRRIYGEGKRTESTLAQRCGRVDLSLRFTRSDHIAATEGE